MDERDEILFIEERRELRRDYRDLRDTINEKARDLSTVGSNTFRELHDQTGALFGKVKCIRELAIDAETLNDFSRGVRIQGNKLADISSNFDFVQFSESLERNFLEEGSGNFSWSKLGRDCGSIFASVSSFSVLLGPLQRSIKARKQTQRKAKETDAVLARPEDIALSPDDEAVEEATNKRCMKLFAELQSQSAKGEVSVVDVLFDPADVVQTVENLFDFSFLIKDKRATLDVNEEDGTMSTQIVNPAQFEENCTKRQMVLALNMKDLKELTKVLNATQPVAGKRTNLHRDDPLYLAETVQEQADLIESRSKMKGNKKAKK